jgi:hypothetical protein
MVGDRRARLYRPARGAHALRMDPSSLAPQLAANGAPVGEELAGWFGEAAPHLKSLALMAVACMDLSPQMYRIRSIGRLNG